MIPKKETLSVLHEKDLKQFLLNFNLYEDVQGNKILCKFCNQPISMENICAIIPSENKIEFVCDKKMCYEIYLTCKEINNDT